jgi:hypothetical protein
LEGGFLATVVGNGKVVQEASGDKITHKPNNAETSDPIAKWLTLQICQRATGSQTAGFNRRLVHPKSGRVR